MGYYRLFWQYYSLTTLNSSLSINYFLLIYLCLMTQLVIVDIIRFTNNNDEIVYKYSDMDNM